MSLSTTEPSSEMAILRRVVDPDHPFLSEEAAHAILSLRFSQADRDRMDELAAKNRRGQLTPAEDEELSSFLRVGQTLGILQSKARRTLKPASDASGSNPKQP